MRRLVGWDGSIPVATGSLTQNYMQPYNTVPWQVSQSATPGPFWQSYTDGAGRDPVPKAVTTVTPAAATEGAGGVDAHTTSVIGEPVTDSGEQDTPATVSDSRSASS